jgi:tRNA (cytidine/uridine-2'-O-)-methyltransferase
MRIALFEPDIPQNTGTILRLAACLGVAVDIIEPAGFAVSDRAFKRAGLDYLDHVDITRHRSFQHFHQNLRQASPQRLVVLTTKARTAYIDFEFSADDTLLLGRESAGVPDYVHEIADARIVIPMRENMRSINIAAAAAMVVGEALRQIKQFPTVQIQESQDQT